MARKRTKVSGRRLFTWFILVGFIFLLTPQNLTGRFQFAFARIFHLPLSIGRHLSLSARTNQPLTGFDPLKEAQYQNHIANLEAQLRGKHKKIEILQQIRDRLYKLESAGLIPADIVQSSLEGPGNELTINRGSKDGLSLGQFVLGCNSIVGTISDVSPRMAKVRLITDTSSQIPVTIAKLDISRVMYGTSGNTAKIPMVSKKNKIKVGQNVFACTKPGLLDVPIIVGKVVRCKTDDTNPLLWDITVEPACDIEKLKLNNVAVIIMNLK